MFRALAVAVVLLVALTVFSGVAQERMGRPMGQMIEGTIENVAPNRVLTLADGTTLTVPVTVMLPREQMRRGVAIIAEFDQKGPQKVATSLLVRE